MRTTSFPGMVLVEAGKCGLTFVIEPMESSNFSFDRFNSTWILNNLRKGRFDLVSH